MINPLVKSNVLTVECKNKNAVEPNSDIGREILFSSSQGTSSALLSPLDRAESQRSPVFLVARINKSKSINWRINHKLSHITVLRIGFTKIKSNHKPVSGVWEHLWETHTHTHTHLQKQNYHYYFVSLLLSLSKLKRKVCGFQITF